MLTLEKKLWDGFEQWLLEDGLSQEALESLLQCGPTLTVLLQEYGQHLFSLGAPLSSFRHILAIAQREVSDFRLYARGCWSLITRWESLEPLVHRAPLPEELCFAIACLAIRWGWHRFGLLLLVGFKGILRPGEFINAGRKDLVLRMIYSFQTQTGSTSKWLNPKLGKVAAAESSILVSKTGRWSPPARRSLG